MKSQLVCVIGVMLGLISVGAAEERLQVHEWGTFTSFHNEAGEALRRINTDDEPVPQFVHQLVNAPRPIQLFPPTEFSIDQRSSIKGPPGADQRVTMRLETPVLYFHLPAGQQSLTVDVEVDFHRGFLTQFFPKAVATVNGQPVDKTKFPRGKPIYSSLHWVGVRVGAAGPMPETTDHVWLAPRQVDAAPVTVGEESERFLFYRGVGDLESPLRVIRHADQILEVRRNSAAYPLLKSPISLLSTQAAQSHPVWLLEVRPDGSSAFRHVPQGNGDDSDADCLFLVPGTFAEHDFSPKNVAALRAEMRDALIWSYLNADEADALLNTWELSYFLSPGQRLFFLVPQEWTDAVLPLKLSVPADVTRVMVGRVELVTPRQRELIRQMAQLPVPDMTEFLEQMKSLQSDPSRREAYNALASGRGDSSILGMPVPPIYQTFLDLGRFRTSLLLDALRRDKQSGANQLDGVMQLQFELLYPGKMKRG